MRTGQDGRMRSLGQEVKKEALSAASLREKIIRLLLALMELYSHGGMVTLVSSDTAAT